MRDKNCLKQKQQKFQNKFILRAVLNTIKTNLTGRPSNIRTENIFLVPVWACQDHNFFLEVSALLYVRHCPMLQSCAISRKTNNANSIK